MKNIKLTDKELAYIKAINYIVSYDGIITSNEDIKYLINQAIEVLIPKYKRHLVSVTETAYPTKIKIIK
jgi:hypothetical protein